MCIPLDSWYHRHTLTLHPCPVIQKSEYYWDTCHQERSHLAVDFLYFLTLTVKFVGKVHQDIAWNSVQEIQEMVVQNGWKITSGISAMEFIITETMDSLEFLSVSSTAERDLKAFSLSSIEP